MSAQKKHKITKDQRYEITLKVAEQRWSTNEKLMEEMKVEQTPEETPWMQREKMISKILPFLRFNVLPLNI